MAELTRAEMLEILEDIARNGNNAAARIAAVKQLVVMRAQERRPGGDPFSDLDEFAQLYELDDRRAKGARR
jgi:hypothetical protein